MKQNFVLRSIFQFLLLMVVWLLLSGHYDLKHLLMGVLSCSIVLILNIRLRKFYYFKEEITETEEKIKAIYPARLRIIRLLFYIPWLIWQIIVASLQVAWVVLHPKMPINPALIRFKTRLPNIASKVILGNSITLTPGTITVNIDDDEFLVHAIMEASFTGIADGSLPSEVAKLYEKKPEQVVKSLKIIKSSKEI